MEPKSAEIPLVVVVGQTASGKSALALKLAEQFGGEIIAADSRTIYQGMNIGTAKPSHAEQQAIRHHLLDITTPDRPLTVADFVPLARQAADDVAGRGKLPFLVGGTGLYVDALLYDFKFRAAADQQRRQELELLSVEELQSILDEQGIPLPNNQRNPRHLIRQIETGGVLAERTQLRQNTLIIGMAVDPQVLKERIVQRVETMMHAGLQDEVRHLVTKYGWECQTLQTIGYQEFRPFFEGQAAIAEVQDAIIRNTNQYAKRQRTWFKRNKSIRWICKQDEAVDLVTTFLSK